MDALREYAVEIFDPQPPDDDCTVTRAVLEALMTQDDAFLRCGRAPLLGFEYFKDLQSRLQAAPVETWAVVPTPHFRARRRRVVDSTFSKEQLVKKRLLERFPLLDELLELGRGRMVMAGGAVIMAILEDITFVGHSHAEFFFHNVGCEEEANELLLRLVRCLLAATTSAGETPRLRAILTRTQTMLQVSLCQGNSLEPQWGGDSEATHYRFRLRLHASVEEALLQMEMAPCGVAFDGHRIVMTPLAAFGLATRSLIADPGARRSGLYEWHLQSFVERGFCILLPSLREDLTGEGGARENNVVRMGQGGRTRGALLQLGGGIMTAGREDDRENHRHNFGHVARRLLLVGDLAPNHSFRAHDMLVSYGYLNIHHVCQEGAASLVTLTGETLEELLERPVAFGLNKIDEVFAERDMSLSRTRLLFGEDAVAYAEAFLNKDVCIDAIVVRAKARVRERLLAAQRPGLQWERGGGGGWGFVAETMPPRQWYPRDLYEPTLTGLPRLYAPVFRQLRAQHAGFASLPKDLMRFLMRNYVIVEDVVTQWLAKSKAAVSETVSCSESETITSEGD